MGATAFYREPPPPDPELLASDPFFWADHAQEDLIAHEERGMRRLWAQIQETTNARNTA